MNSLSVFLTKISFDYLHKKWCDNYIILNLK